jgi:hypothetical protein
MVARTAWAGGSIASGNGAWVPAFGSEINALPASDSVLSSIAFDNTVATLGTPDQFMDISFVGALAAAQTLGTSAGLSFFFYQLQGDNVTYGDGRATATASAFSPLLMPIGGIPFQSGSGITALAGGITGFVLPPRKFALVMVNLTTFPLAASGNSCWISTYRQNVNA